MSARPATSPSSFLAGLLSLLLLAGVLGLLAPHPARADSAPLDPANPATPATVTADPLPTAQINGVAWAQAVVGNTVYVAGQFTRARPAGAAPGTQEVVRNHLLAYDIRTGELIPGFAPVLNAQALSIAATPDGSRIFVGGDFTSVDGQVRNRIAAFSTATGQLVADFRPAFNSQVTALAVTDTTVYAGGWFTAVGTTPRRYVGAVSASNGALLPWAPALSPGNIASPAATVLGLTVTSGGQQVVLAGRFGYINGIAATGVGAVHATTGATRPFAVNQLITNQGAHAAVYSLTSVGDTVYGTGYTFGSPGNFEGTFAAAANGGAVRWIHTCHGDTYSAFPSNGVVYQASHAHNCTNIGSFPEQSPQVFNYGTAVSDAVAGTLGSQNTVERVIAGQPAPALLPWFPTFYAGSYT
ncbi:MAG TPA: radical SAM protein, partial [Blastococcus sp.]|nr:radical SAM protein [Blastococcus sp.]